MFVFLSKKKPHTSSRFKAKEDAFPNWESAGGDMSIIPIVDKNRSLSLSMSIKVDTNQSTKIENR